MTIKPGTPPGTKIVFSHPDAGLLGDQERCKKYLTPGAVYTVKSTEVYAFSTDVQLEEVPDMDFNSVMFEVYE